MILRTSGDDPSGLTIRMERANVPTARAAGTNTFIEQSVIGTHFVGLGCSQRNKLSTTVWSYSNDGNRAFTTRIQKYRGLFGWLGGGRYFNGETKAYKRNNSNSNWRSDRVQRLAVQLWGAARDNGCNNPIFNAGASWPYNASKAETTFYIDNRTSSVNGDIYSNQRMWHNNIQYSQNRVLDVCP